jgi:hypothetical protein
VNKEELSALYGHDEFLFKLYFAGIRQYMDYKTGMVGIKRKISRQSLVETMYIEPRQGVYRSKQRSPSKKQIIRGIEALIRIGVLVKVTAKRRLVFYLPLASKDKSVQNQLGLNWADEKGIDLGTENKPKNPIKIDEINDINNQLGIELSPPKNANLVPPPLSVIKKKKDITNVISKKEKNHSLPDGFDVTEKHIEFSIRNGCPDPHTEIDAFKDYHLARGNVFKDWDRAFYTWLRNAKNFNRKGFTYEKSQSNIRRSKASIFDESIKGAFE